MASLTVLRANRAIGPLTGQLSPPGDKSVSHRALILGALADGDSTVRGLLQAADVRATQSALEQMGARFSEAGDELAIRGIGVSGLRAPLQPLDMGNSGTAMRLLAGVLAAQPFNSSLTGDASLSMRPMHRIFQPLRLMGAEIGGTTTDTAPIEIVGRQLKGIHYRSPVASAQVKSCVLLAGLYADGRTSVSEPESSRDHTERMLARFGVEMENGGLEGGVRLIGTDIDVPADISSAAFLMAAALMVEGSEVVLTRVGINPTRDGFIRALKAMGADMEVVHDPGADYEPTATIRVRYSDRLKAIDLPAEWIPSMVDEVPALMVLASQARGVTRIRGAAELRVKESDRLAVMGSGLRALGVPVKDYTDGVDITGVESIGDGLLESAGDHRCAMSFAVLALRSKENLAIQDAEYIDTSYPGFVDDMNMLGAQMQVVESR